MLIIFNFALPNKHLILIEFYESVNEINYSLYSFVL